MKKLTLIFLLVLTSYSVNAKDYDWTRHDQHSTNSVNNEDWKTFLDRYVKPSSTNINLLDYKNVSQSDRTLLINYIHLLRNTNPLKLNKSEQMAYWINLYNALTVKLILENYPTSSIKKLGKGFFSFGPWDDDVIKINGQVLSLNNIEHDILRPIFKDKRIHYAVNCASIGCPNLSSTPYSGSELSQQLETAACEYTNHPRAVAVKGEELHLSSIYKWYAEDFGSEKDLLNHILDCAQPKLKSKLQQWMKNGSDDIEYDYDWSLNEYKEP